MIGGHFRMALTISGLGPPRSPHVLTHQFDLLLGKLELGNTETQRETSSSVKGLNKGHSMLNQIWVRIRESVSQDSSQFNNSLEAESLLKRSDLAPADPGPNGRLLQVFPQAPTPPGLGERSAPPREIVPFPWPSLPSDKAP